MPQSKKIVHLSAHVVDLLFQHIRHENYCQGDELVHSWAEI